MNSVKCLMIGGPLDGQWVALSGHLGEYRFAVREPLTTVSHHEILEPAFRIERYYPTQVPVDRPDVAVYRHESVEERQVASLLVSGYRVPVKVSEPS